MNHLLDGISFLIRIKNEEKTLQECLWSLRGLNVPHEIIVVLNQCSDASEDIVKDHQKINENISIFYHNFSLSRAGYETLCTDARSPHSLSYYWNVANDLSRYAWRFDWDGDFVMSDSVQKFLENNTWSQVSEPEGVRFYAVGDDGVMHGQEYLFSHHFYADKHWFWHLKTTAQPYRMHDTYLAIWHKSSLNEMKNYWQEPSWFMVDESPEALDLRQKFVALERLLGPEVKGQARASNQDSVSALTLAMAHEKDIMSLGIRPAGGWAL